VSAEAKTTSGGGGERAPGRKEGDSKRGGPRKKLFEGGGGRANTEKNTKKKPAKKESKAVHPPHSWKKALEKTEETPERLAGHRKKTTEKWEGQGMKGDFLENGDLGSI